jgi:large repetitive protein
MPTPPYCAVSMSAETRLRCIVSVLLIFGLMASPFARADFVYQVNTTADLVDDNTDDGICHTSANTCSLRAAIMQANHLTTAVATRIFLPAGFYAITRPINGVNGEDNGDFNLTVPNTVNQFIAIFGAGSASTVIDGNQIDGIFNIDPGRSAGFADLRIRNGLRQGGGSGGGIRNRGSLVIQDCVVEDNYTLSGGGGIYNESLLNIIRSTISGNAAAFNGGGIYSSGTLAVFDSAINANFALQNFGQGGGLYLSGPATVKRSSIFANVANNGGGILTVSQLTLVSSTVSSNKADRDGGGLFNFGTSFLYSSTLVGNDADYDGLDGGVGGGILADATAGHRLVLVNSLIVSNTLRSLPIFSDCSGTLEAYGFNRLGDLSGCVFTGNGGAAIGLVTRATVGPLTDNGGPTLTNALLAGSQAIDSSTAQGCIDEIGAPLDTDQRGAFRVAGARCDLGAYEFGSVIDLIFRNGLD